MSWHAWTLADEAPDGWSHHGLALLPDGTLVGYHPGERQLLFFDAADGALVRRADCEAIEAHDICVAADGASLWLADCGHKLCRAGAEEFAVEPAMETAVGQVLLVDLDGRTLRRYGPPEHPAYAAGGQFLPTGVALDDRGLWIADGYGSNLVHLVDHDGELLLTLDGFDCPHGIAVDRRRPEPLLYIAERGERRLAVHALDGTFLRHAGVGHLLAPCSLATAGDHLLVADLVSRVTVLDLDDELVGHLGADREATKRPGWPNANADGATTAPVVEADRFNSPHGVVVDASGTAFVTEWLLGGRWVRCPVA